MKTLFAWLEVKLASLGDRMLHVLPSSVAHAAKHGKVEKVRTGFGRDKHVRTVRVTKHSHHVVGTKAGGGQGGTQTVGATNTDPNALVFPNFTEAGGPDFKHKILASFYTQGGANPGRDAVNFYQAFDYYLNTTAEWQIPFRMIGGGLAAILWYIDSALNWIYAKLFGILSIRNIEDSVKDYNTKYMGTATHGTYTVYELFKYINDFGLVIFGCVLLAYVIGTTLNEPSWAKYKNIFRNAVVITGFLFLLPTCTEWFDQGVQSVANNMLDDQNMGNPSKIDKNTASIPTQAVSDNVISVPTYLMTSKTQPGEPINGIPSPGYSVHRKPIIWLKRGISGTPGVTMPLLYIDMARMPEWQKAEWNGLDGDTIPSFFHQYGSNSEMLSKDSLPMFAKNAAKLAGDPDSGNYKFQRAHSLAPSDPHSAYHYSTKENPILGRVSNAVGRPITWIARMYHSHKASNEQSGYDKDFQTLFSYDVSGASAGIGSNTEKGLTSHSFKHLSATNDYSDSTPFAKIFLRGYSVYHINWLGLAGQLIMVFLIFGAYIIKLFLLSFKLVTMFISGAALLYRNADNAQRVKNWMRDFWSIYEAAFMDIMMCYITIYILYPAFHDFMINMMAKSHEAYLVNPWTVSLIDILGDIALYVGSLKGLNAVNAAIGSSGGGANSGGSRLFGSIIALKAANTVTNAGRTGIGLAKGAAMTGLGYVAGGAKKGGKHLWNGYKANKGALPKNSHNPSKPKSPTASSNRTTTHNGGPLNTRGGSRMNRLHSDNHLSNNTSSTNRGKYGQNRFMHNMDRHQNVNAARTYGKNAGLSNEANRYGAYVDKHGRPILNRQGKAADGNIARGYAKQNGQKMTEQILPGRMDAQQAKREKINAATDKDGHMALDENGHIPLTKGQAPRGSYADIVGSGDNQHMAVFKPASGSKPTGGPTKSDAPKGGPSDDYSKLTGPGNLPHNSGHGGFDFRSNYHK